MHLYVLLAGKKTIIGAMIGAASAALLLSGNVEAAGYLAMFATIVLIPLGLIDGAWRSAPESWSSYAFYRLLRDHWVWISGVLGSAAVYCQQCDPQVASLLARVHLTCTIALTILTAVTAITGWAVGAAKLAQGPRGPVLQMLQAPTP